VTRRIGRGALVVAVVCGTVLGTIGLLRLFSTERPTPAAGGEELIVFQGEHEGNVDLFAVHPDGSGRRRLTDDPAADTEPAISPDGTRIAFASNRTGTWQVYVMEADGGRATALTYGPSESFEPAWSPDGRRIAFSSNRTGNGDVYVMDADGSNVVQLSGLGLRTGLPDVVGADDSRQFEGSPTWSPDGTRIAFAGEIGDNPDLYVMDADGSSVVRLTDDPTGDWYPAWSPDGKWIAFQTSRGEPASDIYLVRPDGTGLTRVTQDPGRDIQPAWSPDGSRIVFASDRDGVLQLYVMDSDGSRVRRLTESPGGAVGAFWGRTAVPTPTSPEGPSVGPSPSPPEAATPQPTPVFAGTEIEIPAWMLGAWADPACESSARIADFDGEGGPDITMVTRSSCLGSAETEWVLAMEWDGMTTAIRPLPDCKETCVAFTAPDLDADGAHELGIVVEGGPSTQFLHFYQLPATEPDPLPLGVSPPGAPGLPANQPALFGQWGSTSHYEQLACRDENIGRVLIQTSATAATGEHGERVWQVVETRFALIEGRFVILGTREYEADGPSSFISGQELCGSNLGGDVIDG
jgi:TolB protein